jgi:hypothetical protein
MKKGLYIGLLFIVVSCSSTEKVIVGKYKSKTYNIFQRIIMQIKSETSVMGSELELRSDSTYLYISCGNIINGNWRIYSNDTLALFCKNNKFRNDSLNKVMDASCGTAPVKYKILKSGELTREYPIPELEENCIDAFVKY